MGRVITRIITITVSVYICLLIAYTLNDQLAELSDTLDAAGSRLQVFNLALLVILGALIGWLLGSVIYEVVRRENDRLVDELKHYSPYALASGGVGLIAGLLLANLILIPIYFTALSQEAKLGIGAFVSLVLGYIGALVTSRLNFWVGHDSSWRERSQASSGAPKLIDSSALIDGRIAELADIGIIEGAILVPGFILEELQGLADNADSLIRNKGRRGLDIAQSMIDNQPLDVQVLDAPYNKMYGNVDNQLIELAKQQNAWIVSNDYNLCKVAKVQGIRTLNFNELAHAVRPMFLPGEVLRVNVIKYGKEVGQGVAYLEDGTMVVIESGDAFVGETLDVDVTSIIQTVAGRLLFAKPRERD